MLALDMSESNGRERTRLDVVKEVIGDFIDKRRHDRIGLVAFSVNPYLVSALTLDKEHFAKKPVPIARRTNTPNRNKHRLRIGGGHQQIALS